jgi:hypothetical protein
MATNSGAFGAKCGFNQGAGGYYTVLTNIPLANLSNVSVAASGSGGAFVPATLAPYTFDTAYDVSTLVNAGRVLKDMGKTVRVGTRTYRKFQGVASATHSTFGVGGSAPVAPNTGYASFYLEVAGPNGSAVTTGNNLARAL